MLVSVSGNRQWIVQVRTAFMTSHLPQLVEGTPKEISSIDVPAWSSDDRKKDLVADERLPGERLAHVSADHDLVAVSSEERKSQRDRRRSAVRA
jgi:hypothetical protein